MNRRRLLQISAGLLTLDALVAQSSTAGPRKAAIIGHTGAGDYGHGIEKLFLNMPNVEVVAVSDPVEAGRAKAKTASHATRDYADYREMLEKEKPELVAVGPRWSGEHHAMTLAALNAGAHVYLEKPFTLTLAEADELLKVAKEKDRRIAVAHVARISPGVLRLEKALKEGLIGDVLEIHTVGKMGSRSGGQDMMVLGLHVFDMARLFAGNVEWCQARIRLKGGIPSRAGAVESPSDKVGPVVGDDIFAHFAMDSGINVTFRSRVGLEKAAGPFGMEIIGSKGIVRLASSATPTFSLLKDVNRAGVSRTENWVPWTGGVDPASEAEIDGLTGYDAAHRHAVRDWLASMEEKRDPLCSGERAMKAIEMAHGVFQAGLSGEQVRFPLEKRGHPLIG